MPTKKSARSTAKKSTAKKPAPKKTRARKSPAKKTARAKSTATKRKQQMVCAEPAMATEPVGGWTHACQRCSQIPYNVNGLVGILLSVIVVLSAILISSSFALDFQAERIDNLYSQGVIIDHVARH